MNLFFQRSKISTAIKLGGWRGLGLNGPAIKRRTFFAASLRSKVGVKLERYQRSIYIFFPIRKDNQLYIFIHFFFELKDEPCILNFVTNICIWGLRPKPSYSNFSMWSEKFIFYLLSTKVRFILGTFRSIKSSKSLSDRHKLFCYFITVGAASQWWSNDCLLQAYDGKMLVNDGEMLVNDGKKYMIIHSFHHHWLALHYH